MPSKGSELTLEGWEATQDTEGIAWMTPISRRLPAVPVWSSVVFARPPTAASVRQQQNTQTHHAAQLLAACHGIAIAMRGARPVARVHACYAFDSAPAF